MELRGAVRRSAEWVELDFEMTVIANRLGQRRRADYGRDIIDRTRRRRSGDRGGS